MYRLYCLSLCLVLSTILGGCGGGHSSSSNTATEYRLVYADSRALPSAIFDDDLPGEHQPFHFRAVVHEGAMVMRSDGTFEHRITGKTYIDGHGSHTLHYVDQGRYTRVGPHLHFASSYIENRTYDATLVNNELNISTDVLGDGMSNTFTYRQ